MIFAFNLKKKAGILYLVTDSPSAIVYNHFNTIWKEMIGLSDIESEISLERVWKTLEIIHFNQINIEAMHINPR